MAKKPIRGLTAALLDSTPNPELQHEPMPGRPSSAQKPVALTLKVPEQLYQRLKLYGVRRRRSNQAILLDALVGYLDREEPT